MSDEEKEFVPLIERPRGKPYVLLLSILSAVGIIGWVFYYATVSPLSENRRAFKSDGLWGYKDADGKIIIAAQYDSAATFSKGYAIVTKKSKFGTIDPDGKILSPIIIDKIDTELVDLSVRPVHVGDKKSFLMPDGELLFEPGFATFENDKNEYRRSRRFAPLGVTLGARNIVVGRDGKILFDNENSGDLAIDYDGHFVVSFVENENRYAAHYSDAGDLIFKSDKFDKLNLSNYNSDGGFYLVEKNDRTNLFNMNTGSVVLPWDEGSIHTGYNGFKSNEGILRENQNSDILYSSAGKTLASYHDIARVSWDGLRRIQCSDKSKQGLISDNGKKSLPCVFDRVVWTYDEKLVELSNQSYVFEDATGKKFANADDFILDLKKGTCLKESKSGANPKLSSRVSSIYASTVGEMGCVSSILDSSDLSSGSFSIKFVNENAYPVKVEAGALSTVFEGRYSPDKVFCRRPLSKKVVWIEPNGSTRVYFSGGCKRTMGWLRRYSYAGADIKNVEKKSMSELNSAKSVTTTISGNTSSRPQTKCSKYTDINFDAGSFISDNAYSLNVQTPSGVYVNSKGDSYVALSSDRCISGRFNYSYSVKTGVYQDRIKTFSGAFSLSGNQSRCTIFVDGGGKSCN